MKCVALTFAIIGCALLGMMFSIGLFGAVIKFWMDLLGA